MIHLLSVEEVRNGNVFLEPPDNMLQEHIVVEMKELGFSVERGDILEIDIQQNLSGAIEVTVIGKDEKERHRRASKRSLYDMIKARLEKK